MFVRTGFCLILVVTGLLGTDAAQADSVSFLQLLDFRVTRTRLEQQMTIESVMYNTNTAPITDVRIQSHYYDERGKVLLRSPVVQVARIKGSARRKFTLHTKRTPAYETYVIVIRGKHQDKSFKQEFRGKGMGPPEWYPTGTVSDEAVVKIETLWDKRVRRDVTIQGKLKNYGEKPAHGVAIHLKFLGKKGTVKTYTHELEDAVPGGKEVSFKFKITRCPTYESYTKKLDYRFENSASGPVGAGGLRTVSVSGTGVKIHDCKLIPGQGKTPPAFSGVLDNQDKEAIKDIEVIVSFQNKTGRTVRKIRHVIRLRIPPNFQQPFTFTLDDLPSYSTFNVSLKFQYAD